MRVRVGVVRVGVRVRVLDHPFGVRAGVQVWAWVRVLGHLLGLGRRAGGGLGEQARLVEQQRRPRA